MRKIHYVPGMISLLVMPLGFFFFSRQYITTLNTHTIPITWPDFEFMGANPEFFAAYHGHFPPGRNYTTIEITDHSKTNQIKLDFADISIRQLVASKDTSNGLRFVFTNQSNYQSFVAALDICRLAGVQSYMPHENNLWVYNLPKITRNETDNLPPLDCGTTSILTSSKQLRKYNTGRNALKILDSSWHIMLGFITLFFFSVRSFRRGK